MGNVSSCWQSVSHAAGQWEKQRSKQAGQTNAEERVGRGQAAAKERGQPGERGTLKRTKDKADRNVREGQRSVEE